jgi:hypothetical protein
MIGRKEVAAAEALVAWQNPREAHPNFSDDLGGWWVCSSPSMKGY